MERFPLYMTHDLQMIPTFPLAERYQFRLYEKGDEVHWAYIVTKTEEFPTEKAAMARFTREFFPFLEELKKRMIFLETKEGEVIATCTAWFGEWEGKQIGRLHWLSIIPEYQGKKLAKPLVTKAMHILSSFHNEAYLKTQTTSLPAINMYLQLGFQPVISNEQDETNWSLVKEKLQNQSRPRHN